MLSFTAQLHSMNEDRYSARGVSATKDEVHKAIAGLDKGLVPNAFCKILPDLAAGDPAFCNILHADTAGTKTSLAYIYWKETGDVSVWKGIAQDAIVMNLDDMACVGCVDDILLSNTIGRNKHLIPGEVIQTLIAGTVEFVEKMAGYGVNIKLAGGETADVGDIVRTIDVGFTAFARMPREKLVVNRIEEGNVIVGLASFGRAVYEDAYNGGMGSNGLTSARHDVFINAYAEKYPESFDPNTPSKYVYSGMRQLTDLARIDDESIPFGKLVLSPTRTYLPVMKAVLRELGEKINGLIHCTGGGQTKVSKFLLDGLTAVKDNLFEPPVLFKEIQEISGTGWREMYQVFNMGSRLEVYCPEDAAEEIISMARAFDIEARIIGRVESGHDAKVIVRSPYGTFAY